jgi:hypothetical protein
MWLGFLGSVPQLDPESARYNQQTGKWEWGDPPKEPKAWEVQ